MTGFLRTILAVPAALLAFLLTLPILVPSLLVWGLSRLIFLGTRLFEPRYAAWNEVIEFDSRFGWRPRGNLDTYHLADDLFHVTTDPDGWRGSQSIQDCRILVLGDSFAWGHGIDDRDFFANRLLPRLSVKAIGANGYNMVQELLWLQALSSSLQGKTVVWFVYYGNDLYENLVPDMHGYRMPFVRERDGRGEWEIVTSHIQPQCWPFNPRLGMSRIDYFEKLAEVCSPGVQSERAYAACEYLLRKGRSICDRAGASLVVLGIPERSQLTSAGNGFLKARSGNSPAFDPDLPDRRLAAICKRLNIPFLALKDYLDPNHYKGRDWHWNEKGHSRVAEILETLHRDPLRLHFRSPLPNPILPFSQGTRAEHPRGDSPDSRFLEAPPAR